MRRALVPLLIVLAGYAGEVYAQENPDTVPAGPELVPDIEALNPLASVDSPERGAFAGRPLFVPARRPPAPAAEPDPAAQAAVVPPLDLMLLGVMQTPEQRIARVVDRNANGQSYSLRVGDYIGDWRVEEVGVRSIRLNRNGEALEFEVGQ